MDSKNNEELFYKYKRRLNKSNFLHSFTSVMVYGAGNCGKDVLDLFNSKGIPVKCFLDQNGFPGMNFKGIPILKADDSSITFAQRKDNCIVVAIFNPNSNINEIIKYLKCIGYESIITFVELYELFSDFFGERLWLTSLSNYDNMQYNISKAQAVWADDKSSRLYESVLKFRASADYAFEPPPQQIDQYLPKDVPGWKLPKRYVDCGAYDGDTLASMYRRTGTIEAIAAFEPDNSTFLRLIKFIRSSEMKLASEIYLWPCGVWSGTEQLNFLSGKGEGSNVSNEGDSVIQCISLDEALNGFEPTFIKMDIEGSEYHALLGAKETIKDNHPQMAVCLYHRPEDLWQIPLLLQEWGYGYKFYLRVHRFNCFELVLYAI